MDPSARSAPPADARSAASADRAWDALVREVVEARARRDPAWSTTIGWPGHDSELADPASEATRARIAELDELVAQVDALEGAPEIDRLAVLHALRLERFELAELKQRERNPDFAVEVLDHIFPLLIRTTRPVAPRVDALIARLARAGEYLADARGRLGPLASVPPLWAEVARETAAAAPGILDAAAALAPGDARLAEAAGAARAALADHARWLETTVTPAAKGNFAIGRPLFDRLLAMRGIDADAPGLVAIGETLVAAHRARLSEAAGLVLAAAGDEPGRADDVARALARARRDHPPNFESVLESYRLAIDAARKFTIEHDLARVPDVPLDVIETPAYLRHLVPFAAYVEPGWFDASPRGTYLVTPKVDLSAFPHSDIRATTVHEAVPGHHLQLSRAREAPLARVLVAATEIIEGWALYCEALAGRHGFDNAPASRLVRERDALWRAVRIVLDVGLSTGTID
ncbi:MAG: DUF885 family protein, partial [Thermoplasmatota archaeon]